MKRKATIVKAKAASKKVHKESSEAEELEEGAVVLEFSKYPKVCIMHDGMTVPEGCEKKLFAFQEEGEWVYFSGFALPKDMTIQKVVGGHCEFAIPTKILKKLKYTAIAVHEESVFKYKDNYNVNATAFSTETLYGPAILMKM